MSASHAVPFRLSRSGGARTADGRGWASVQWVDEGLVRLEGAELVLQSRLTTTEVRGVVRTVEPGPLREVRIPVAAIRSARLTRAWWRPRLEIAAADLRGFEGAPGLAGDRIVLPVPRRERAEAADLAATLSLAAAERRLDAPLPGPRPGPGPS